ncbi:unnamed protein product, partial [marine sediment metagenome]
LIGQFSTSTVDLFFGDTDSLESTDLSLKIDDLDNMLDGNKLSVLSDLIPQGDIQNLDDTGNVPDWKTDKAGYAEYLKETLLNLGEGTWKKKAKRLNDKSILTASGKTWTDNNLREVVKKLKGK